MKHDPEELLSLAIHVIGGRRGQRGGRGNLSTSAYMSFGKTHARLVVPKHICSNLGWTPGQSKISILRLPNDHWVACETREGNILSTGGKGSPTAQFTGLLPSEESLKEILCEVDSNILVFTKSLRIS